MENLPRPQPMSFFGDLAVNWKICKTDLQTYMAVLEWDQKHEKAQRYVFLSYVGEECKKICSTLIGESDDLKTIIAKLDNYFIPKTNKYEERYIFNNMSKKAGMSIDSYVQELRYIASKCEYKDNDEMILDKIISGVKNEKKRTRLIADTALTLQKAVEIYKQLEAEEPTQIPKKAVNAAGFSGLSPQGMSHPPENKKRKTEVGISPKMEPQSRRKCGICKQEGHFRTKCPVRIAIEAKRKKKLVLAGSW